MVKIFVKIIRLYLIKKCSIIASWVIMGTTKTRNRMGLTGIDRDPSRVLAFGTIGSLVPGFDVIAITDITGLCPWLFIIVTRW